MDRDLQSAAQLGTTPIPVGELLHDIGHDLQVIASDELELVRRRLTASVHGLLMDALGAALAGAVALIGIGSLCVVVVVALAPVMPALWLRLLLMAVVYVAVGGAAAYGFVARMRTHGPDLSGAAREARQTIAAVTSGLEH
jgi:hypothetical protein